RRLSAGLAEALAGRGRRTDGTGVAHPGGRCSADRRRLRAWRLAAGPAALGARPGARALGGGEEPPGPARTGDAGLLWQPAAGPHVREARRGVGLDPAPPPHPPLADGTVRRAALHAGL